MFRFIACVVEAVAEKGLKGLVEMVPGGAYAWDLAERVQGKLQRLDATEQRAAIEQIAGQSFESARIESASAVRDLSTDPVEKIVLEQYLAAVPEAVRQSLKRPDDPTGKSVPRDFVPRTVEDVLRMLPARPPRFKPNDDLPQRRGWRLDRLLGVGGFGEVWLARNTLSSKLVGAVKFCLGEEARDLRHEAAVITRLMDADDHPNLVKIKDACLDGETPWLMFDYVPGGTLTDWIHELQRMPVDQRQEKALAFKRPKHE